VKIEISDEDLFVVIVVGAILAGLASIGGYTAVSLAGLRCLPADARSDPKPARKTDQRDQQALDRIEGFGPGGTQRRTDYSEHNERRERSDPPLDGHRARGVRLSVGDQTLEQLGSFGRQCIDDRLQVELRCGGGLLAPGFFGHMPSLSRTGGVYASPPR
jgi:hypothetical protein